jgi:hypothetical protein
MTNTYKTTLCDDLYLLMMRCLACILIPLCLIVGITLGLQAGRDIGAICRHNRGAAAEVTP